MTTEIRIRRTPPAGLGQMLAAARMRRGWRRREAARLLGLSPTYMLHLEAGVRCPSRTVAEHLADGLGLDDTERAQLMASAVDDAGADHPARRQADPESGIPNGPLGNQLTTE